MAWPDTPGRLLGPYDGPGSTPLAGVEPAVDPDTPYSGPMGLAEVSDNGRGDPRRQGALRSDCVTAAATRVLIEAEPPASGTRRADEPPPREPVDTVWATTLGPQ